MHREWIKNILRANGILVLVFVVSTFTSIVFMSEHTRATGGFITYGENKYDLSAANLTHQKSISGQATFSSDVNFNHDGSKMYVVDTSLPNIYEYSLSNPFDISTAYYPYYSIASQEGTSQDVVFNNTGSKMYVLGATSDKVWQYTLSTPFDATTATINAGTDFKSILSQDTTATGLRFNDTGTKMYVIGQANDKVWQYTLSTPFDVTTATINAGTDFKLISAQETTAGGLSFNATGTKMYVVGITSDKVWQYTLSTPFDVTTATINAGTDFKSIVAQDSTSSDVTFNDDGTKMYLLGSANDKVWQYTLSSAFDVTTATINAGTDYISINTQDPTANGVKFNDDGTKMYIVGQTSDGVNEFSLSTPYDVTTATQPILSVSSQDSAPNDVVFNADGTQMYVMGRTNKTVYQYSLSTGFDITTASIVQNFSVSAQEGVPTALDFNSDGTKMFVLGASGDSVYEYDLGTGFDISTAGYIQSFSTSNEDIAATGIAFSANGTRMFIVGQQNHTVFMYSLTTAFDISTAAYVNSYYIGNQEAASTGLAFSGDGSSMYVIGTNSNKVSQYSTTGTASGFTEDALNNGLVNGQLVFEINGDTFQDNNADDILDIGSEVIVNNIPAGLNPQIVLSQNDTVATMTFDGAPAIDHENINDVADITFEFDDSAFMGGDASAITGATGPASSGFGIDFNDRLFLDISRISVDSNGAEGNSSSTDPSISKVGRYVAYTSSADNLVANDNNGQQDVFLYDTVTETTKRISVDSNGNEGNDASYEPSISADGRYVAYTSVATNLVSGDNNGARDIFLYDTVNETTTRVSVDSNGNEGNSTSQLSSVSADGRYITFTSSSSNIVSGDNNALDDIFRYDRVTGNTIRISVDSNGNEADNNSYYSDISGDGRYIVYNSDADNLVSGDNNVATDVFLYDTTTGTTTRVSVDSNGNEGNDAAYWDSPTISSDGKYVVYASNATNMVAGDTNAKLDVFRHKLSTGETTRISVDSNGNQGNDDSVVSADSVSEEGRYITFWSTATSLVTGDTNALDDIFRHDTLTGITTRIPVSNSGGEANAGQGFPAISGNGRYVVYASDANNLVGGDTNVIADVFLVSSSASHTATYSAGSHGSLSGNTSQDIAYGQSGAAVTAVPDSGYHFVQWSDNSTQNPRTDTNVTANISVTASFAANTSSGSRASNSSSNTIRRQTSSAAVPSDSDSIPNDIEDAAPNDGDANDDGKKDSQQNNVASFVNNVTKSYSVLEVPDTCIIQSALVGAESRNAVQDPNAAYPLGLMNFTVKCTVAGQTVPITQYYYTTTNIDDLVMRKYNATQQDYQDLSDATLDKIKIADNSVAKAQYSIVDGGQLDEDGLKNNVIVDPSGPARELHGTHKLAAKTKPQQKSDTSSYVIAAVLLVCGCAAIVFVMIKRKRKSS